jgi:hypothetical protein
LKLSPDRAFGSSMKLLNDLPAPKSCRPAPQTCLGWPPPKSSFPSSVCVFKQACSAESTASSLEEKASLLHPVLRENSPNAMTVLMRKILAIETSRFHGSFASNPAARTLQKYLVSKSVNERAQRIE